jgi:Fe-S cluster assembly protein SufD
MTPDYVALFEEISAELPGARLPWLRTLRREAIEHFAAHGFPTRRDEDRRFTDVSAIAETPFEHGLPRVVHSAPVPGVRIARLDEILERDPERLEPHLARLAESKANGFAALNTALFETGLVVEIEPGARVAEPIAIEIAAPDAATATAAHGRILVLAGRDSEAVVLERYSGSGAYLQNQVTEVVVESHARLEHVRVQRESPAAYHVATLVAHQADGSHFASHSIALGARIARVDVQVHLGAEGADCHLNGLYLGRDRQLIDHHTGVDHAVPHTKSRELYKGILDGRAHGVFRGRIHVRPHAQKTDAEQTNRNLLLSDDASVNTKPQLEIHADDVKCAHGASIGRLDPNALFYLRSRGIELGRARALLAFAFASEIVGRLPIAALRQELEDVVLGWLPEAIAEGGIR